MNPEMKISKFSFEIIRTNETPTPATESPLSEASFTTGAQNAITTITGSGTTSAMQKSVNFQDALGYK